MELMLLTKLAPFVAQDGGALVPRTVDFLAAWGLLPVQATGRGVAVGFAGGACCATKTTLGLRRIFVYFSFVLGFSVRILVNIISSICAKKKTNTRNFAELLRDLICDL
jgi:hypothetical protein